MAVTPLQNFRASDVLWATAGATLRNLDDPETVRVIVLPGMTLSEGLRAFLQAVTEIP